MATRADDYEEFLASIISGISESQRKIIDIGSGRANRLRGESGQPHQVDVSFIDRSFEEETLVLVECKRYESRKVSANTARILAYNARDIRRNPDHPDRVVMIIVTTTAFQEGAQRIAEHEEIRLHRVEHGPPFGFDYEDIIFISPIEHVTVDDVPTVEIEPPSED